MMTDQELVDDIINGSQSAMEVLVKRHYSLVYAYMYRKTNNKDTAYDLTQEIFIKMLSKIKLYSSSGEFAHWLLKIATNHFRDYIKSRSFVSSQMESEYEDTHTNHQTNVTYLYEKNQEREEISQALNQLSVVQKEAILLKYFHDLKIKEIAEITSANESTVKSRLKQGLQKLSILLRREQNETNSKRL
ncbi:RNA polymerase sigma factor [Bacillus sp. FJAT-49736]|uniref:RNA polymerase sigma factor n=1 Tax=Bacillus sp. FJAT-49736 TaxID=2833582 RepID=UPI001BC8CFEA|nr:RNA polymerase sigma factor [Bacillus sp. FJAT-49736]MBS4175222.1 RNA polymerase sigma factor [Bacillus sp. FJAT-49736]